MKINFNKYLLFFQESKNILIGLLIGSLGGALVMLIFAPQSGKITRAQIFHRGTNLQN